ncbi:hypothetical protein ACA910_010710 [Epithemia clementina (nom. ined.)]
METAEDEEARHRREEQERRAKRKAQKASKSDAQKEKDRRGKEYRQQILKQHAASGQQDPAAKKQKLLPEAPEGSGASEFQKLFEQRAQGFQIDFRFRNAPPRPPVGPCFVGQSLDDVLRQHAQHYRALNTVEVHHRWRLHNESDLGVPLAPSAMDVKSYKALPKNAPPPPLHPDDEALLNWKGPLGDTAAEELKVKQDRARAAARAAAAGRPLPTQPASPAVPAANAASAASVRDKKAFSRVLKEDGAMPTFMKKTTYLSNDYSRKVHDFKSLAQTKQQLAKDLEKKQVEMAKRRSTGAIVKSFDNSAGLSHPSKKSMKPKKVYSVLPAVEYWGLPFTHLVIDKKPSLPEKYKQTDLRQGLVANVEKPEQNARMSCELFVPSRREEQEKKDYYEVVQSYDLDVIPLKDEDAPHVHFCFVLDPESGEASYIPISSRIQLSTGRPTKPVLRSVRSRPETVQEQTEREHRVADVDLDMAEKHNIDQDDDDDDDLHVTNTGNAVSASRNDDGEDDFGDDDDDDDSGDEALFGGASTIVAEN